MGLTLLPSSFKFLLLDGWCTVLPTTWASTQIMHTYKISFFRTNESCSSSVNNRNLLMSKNMALHTHGVHTPLHKERKSSRPNAWFLGHHRRRKHWHYIHKTYDSNSPKQILLEHPTLERVTVQPVDLQQPRTPACSHLHIHPSVTAPCTPPNPHRALTTIPKKCQRVDERMTGVSTHYEQENYVFYSTNLSK